MRKRARERGYDEWRDWPNLPSDLIDHIAGRLLRYDVAEYFRLRAACKEWRACTTDPRTVGNLESRFRPRHWIMFSSSVQGPRRQFFNTSTGACAHVDVPELSGHSLQAYTEGLLLLRDEASHAVRLLNPLTRALTDLPPITAELGGMYVAWKRDAILACNVYAGISDETSPATVVLMQGYLYSIAYAKPGDERWAVMDRECWKSLPTRSGDGSNCKLLDDIRSVSVLTTRGCVYLSTMDGNILKVSIHPEPRLVPVVANTPFDLLPSNVVSYLVPADDRRRTMFMVRCYLTLGHLSPEEQRKMKRRKDVIKVPSKYLSGRYSWQLMQVFKVDLAGERLVPVADIGRRALFIGDAACLSVSAERFPSLAGNAVYLGVNSTCPASLFGVRYLRDRSIDPPFQFALGDHKMPYFGWCGIKSEPKIMPLARPCTLQEYIVCYRYHGWNQGLEVS